MLSVAIYIQSMDGERENLIAHNDAQGARIETIFYPLLSVKLNFYFFL